MARSHPPWTARDLSALVQAAAQGANADQIATKLRRSWIDVVRKAEAEGIALDPVYKSSFVYGKTDEAYWNTGMPWSREEIRDLRYAAKRGDTLEEVSIFLMRTPVEVLAKAAKLGLTIRQNNRARRSRRSARS